MRNNQIARSSNGQHEKQRGMPIAVAGRAASDERGHPVQRTELVSVPEPDTRRQLVVPADRGRARQAFSPSADRVLVLSTSTANTLLPTVLALPMVVDAPRMPALAVVLSNDDPLPGCSVVVYQAKTVYRPWLVERIGTVTEATLRSVFAVMVGYLDR